MLGTDRLLIASILADTGASTDRLLIASILADTGAWY